MPNLDDFDFILYHMWPELLEFAGFLAVFALIVLWLEGKV